MPYTRITPSRNGREAIAYALGGEKGHNGAELRNLYVCTVGLTPSQPPSYADQMDEYWKQASSRNKNQVRRIITSYSKDELDPEDPKSAFIAAEIAREHAKKYYPGRQVLICVQKDGVGGCIHTHALVNNVAYDTLKGCTDEQTKFHYVAKSMDEVAKQFIELSMDYTEKYDEVTGRAILPKDKVSQNVRRMRDANREAGTQQYIWEDDLKGRVADAMREASSREDFEKRLTAHGVEIGRNGFSKKHGEYFTYELIDTAGFEGQPPKALKARSYNLGADFTPEALDKLITERSSREVKTANISVRAENAPQSDFTVSDVKVPAEDKEVAQNGSYEPKTGKRHQDVSKIFSKTLEERPKPKTGSRAAELTEKVFRDIELMQQQELDEEKEE